VIDENMRDEMKITVIATGFDRESVAVVSAGSSSVLPANASRYTQRPTDELPRPMMNHPRADDLDVPTFIRKKAD
jgi:cell division protein FtsZ